MIYKGKTSKKIMGNSFFFLPKYILFFCSRYICIALKLYTCSETLNKP